MVTQQVDIGTADIDLDELLAQVREGTVILLMEGDKLLARLTPAENLQTVSRTPGLGRGTIEASDDFDVPLSDSFWLGEDEDTI